jgi:hypothetical protein
MSTIRPISFRITSETREDLEFIRRELRIKSLTAAVEYAVKRVADAMREEKRRREIAMGSDENKPQ